MRARARARWRDRLRAWLLWTPLRPIRAHAIPLREEIAAIRAQLAVVSRRYDLIEAASLEMLLADHLRLRPHPVFTDYAPGHPLRRPR